MGIGFQLHVYFAGFDLATILAYPIGFMAFKGSRIEISSSIRGIRRRGHTVAAMSGLRAAVTTKQLLARRLVLADIAFELAAGERAAFRRPVDDWQNHSVKHDHRAGRRRLVARSRGRPARLVSDRRSPLSHQERRRPQGARRFAGTLVSRPIVT